MEGRIVGLWPVWRAAARVGVVFALALIVAGVLAGRAQAVPVCDGTTCTETFAFTGGGQVWTVPAEVTSATFEVWGASGGGNNFGLAGLGGRVLVSLAVVPGSVYQVMVGGAGNRFGPAGFNGGGAGGALGPGTVVEGVEGGGGGGASDVRFGACAATLGCGLAARVIVAGGGGGSVGAGGSFNARGGDGGHPSGTAGDTGTDGSGGGGGGSGSAGGGGGTGGSPGGGAGTAGGLAAQDQGGAGGPGGTDGATGGSGGGGGGGGYWGGGGGGGGGFAGISGAGGGGSSFGPTGAAFQTGVHSGNGLVTVTYGDPGPAAAADAYSTNEDTLLSVAAPGVLGNDSDVDGDPLTAVLVSAPAHGTLVFNQNGSFTYMPNAGYNGPDSFLYRASDGVLQSNQTTVSITVKAIDEPGPPPGANKPPTVAVAGGGSCVSGERGTLRLTVGDAETPAAGLSLSASSSDPGVVPSGNVVFGGGGADRTVTIAAVAQQSSPGSATVTVTVGDGQGGSATTSVQVIVGTGQADTLMGSAGADMVFGLGRNDTINAGEGHDLVCGGSGADTISGGAGNDTLIGGAGRDTLRGNDGDDVLRGAAGNDRLQGGNGDDTLTGGKGADHFNGGPGTDTATDLNRRRGDTGSA
jgi:hypothetical protein